MAEVVATVTPAVRRDARRGLAVFFVLVVVLSGILEATWILNPEMGILVLPLMWSPAIASAVTRLVLREGFSDVSFRFGGRRTLPWIALGLIVPLVVGILSYGPAWLTGLAGFDGSTGSLVMGLVVATTLGTVQGCLFTAGEEIGWRGYMLTRLIDAGVPRPVLASGLIWGIWHMAGTLTGVYATGPSPVLSTALLMVTITSLSYVIGRMRLETGSIWPGIVAHSAWNSVIQGPLDGSTVGAGAALWTGESGILTIPLLVVVAVLVSRGPWTYIRSLPGRGVPLSQQIARVT